MATEIKPTVSIEVLEQLDIRLGKVLSAEPAKDAPKPSYKLTVDFGKFGGCRCVEVLLQRSKKERQHGLCAKNQLYLSRGRIPLPQPHILKFVSMLFESDSNTATSADIHCRRLRSFQRIEEG